MFMLILKHILGTPRGKPVGGNVVVPISPGATVIWEPNIGVPPAIVMVGVNVPLLPPEFAQVTTISTIAGQPVVHVVVHPLMQDISPTVMFWIVIFAGICMFDPYDLDP